MPRRSRAPGPGGATVTSIYDGSSTSALLTGLMWPPPTRNARRPSTPASRSSTAPCRRCEMIDALRADQWLQNHPERRRGDAARHQAAGARRVLHRHRCLEGADRRAGAWTPPMPRCAASRRRPEHAVTPKRRPGACERGSGPCDHGPSSPGGPTATAHPTGTLAATILGSSLAFIDGSVVNVGLPAIQRDLGASGASIAWLVNAYLLPLGALVLFGGVAGDRWGRRRTSSPACSSSRGVARLRRGAELRAAARRARRPGHRRRLPDARQPGHDRRGVRGEARGRAVGTWAAAGAITGAIGPLAGGWLIDASAGARSSSSTCRSPRRPPGSPGATSRRAAAATGAARLGRRDAGDGGPRARHLSGSRVRRRSAAADGAGAAAQRDGGRHRAAAAIGGAVGVALLIALRRGSRRAAATGDDAARAVRHAQLRRRDAADALPLRRARRHAGAAAVPADRDGGYSAAAAGASLLPLADRHGRSARAPPAGSRNASAPARC